MKKKSKSVLLVVDDENTVCRALTRILQGTVDKVWTATNAAEAQSILESGHITHIICDQWFGPGQPLGTELLAEWKQEYKSVKRAILLTGTPIEKIKKRKNIDEILPKVVDPIHLINVLELDES